jgi:ABC-type uncharacterized transport system ATPase subunit
VSLELRGGEITAIAGVSGNGQLALADLLCGLRAAFAGSVWRAEPLPQPAWVVRGRGRIPEDRHGVGVVGDLPVWENAVSERLRTPAFSRGLLVRRGARARMRSASRRPSTCAAPASTRPARALSGGNMQKLILGRALLAPDGARRA